MSWGEQAVDEREPQGARWVLPWEWDVWSITALIKVCGCSQSGFARQAGISSSALTNWLHKGVAPNPASARQLYVAWAGLPEADREIFAALLASAPRGKVVSMDRRQMLVAAVAGLPVPAEVVERILAGGPVDASLVAGHEVMADVLASQFWTAHIEVLLLALVNREAGMLLDLLDRPMGGDERRRLDALAVGAYVQAGALAFKAGRRVDARGYFALARDVADDSGDPALQAQALVPPIIPGMPWHTSHGAVVDPSRAGRLLSGALDLARGADGRILAWVHRWMAVVSAAKGDERGSRAHADQADRALDEAPAREPVGFLDRFAAAEGQESGATEGLALRLLGRADDADAALARALAATAPDWTSWRAMLLLDVAALRVLQKAPEEACASLVSALGFAGEKGYLVALGRALGVRSTFPKPWAANPRVRELDDLLRRLVAAARLSSEFQQGVER